MPLKGGKAYKGDQTYDLEFANICLTEVTPFLIGSFIQQISLAVLHMAGGLNWSPEVRLILGPWVRIPASLH